MATVLLVDDSRTQLRLREAVLRDAGIDVATASTADDALKHLTAPQAATLRLIITDHVMPGQSGAMFVRELRRRNQTVGVIVITGMAEAETEYEGLNVRFLHKPCAPEELIRLALDTTKSGSAALSH